jgi:hypothetical protein
MCSKLFDSFDPREYLNSKRTPAAATVVSRIDLPLEAENWVPCIFLGRRKDVNKADILARQGGDPCCLLPAAMSGRRFELVDLMRLQVLVPVT